MLRRTLLAPVIALLVVGFPPASPGAASRPTCLGEAATKVGTKGSDVLRGTAKRDVIVGRGGNDLIFGVGANDRICGGPGHDRLYAGRGSDRVAGDSGNDSLFGEDGKDLLLGGRGSDGCLAGGGGGTKRSCAVVVAGAGDIACEPGQPVTPTRCHHKAVSDLLISLGLVGVLTLGDTQYEDNTLEKFMGSYHPTWGRVKDMTHPAVGNHEYLTPGAVGYFDYFNGVGQFTGPAGDRDKGYYSYDLDRWHVIVLNSNCSAAGGCHPGSAQHQWLAADLAAHRATCTLAYWHIPRFSSGGRGSVNTAHLWQLLYDNDADVVLSAHDHIYERFAPQNPAGAFDAARGIRQFTVGTGGSDLTELPIVAPNSEVRDNTTYGVLALTLRRAGYSWRFVPERGGAFTDAGSGVCH